MNPEPRKAPEPTDDLDQESLRLAFGELPEIQKFVDEYARSVDNKTIAVFTVASLILTMVPVFGELRSSSLWTLALWIVALSAWLTASVCCWWAFGPREWKIGPDPKKLVTKQLWLRNPPKLYMYYRIWYAGLDFEANRLQCNKKSRFLRAAILATAIEIAALAGGLITSSLANGAHFSASSFFF